MEIEVHGIHGIMAMKNDSPDMGRTSIQVSEELADELYEMKKRGESYEDVIWRLIDDSENAED